MMNNVNSHNISTLLFQTTVESLWLWTMYEAQPVVTILVTVTRTWQYRRRRCTLAWNVSACPARSLQRSFLYGPCKSLRNCSSGLRLFLLIQKLAGLARAADKLYFHCFYSARKRQTYPFSSFDERADKNVEKTTHPRPVLDLLSDQALLVKLRNPISLLCHTLLLQ